MPACLLLVGVAGMQVWVNVSRSWASLESIFLASADIRSQLPDDTKRFEQIDSEFKTLMKARHLRQTAPPWCRGPIGVHPSIHGDHVIQTGLVHG